MTARNLDAILTTRDYHLVAGPPVIRTRLDWARVCAASWPVDAFIVDASEDVAGWTLAWYVDGDGNPCTYERSGARPITIEEFWSGRVLAKSERRATVERLATAHTGTLTFLAATYALPTGEQLVLDGNHRLAGLPSAAAFRITVVSLRGPLDATVLPDLRHHGARALPSEVRHPE